MRRVWTLRDGELAEEWLAWLKYVRHFVERSNQDAKSETGWDEFQAQKYRAWEHHLALTILATWFIAQTKYDWAQTHARDPQLAQQMELEVLPALSVANVRELLPKAYSAGCDAFATVVARTSNSFGRQTSGQTLPFYSLSPKGSTQPARSNLI